MGIRSEAFMGYNIDYEVPQDHETLHLAHENIVRDHVPHVIHHLTMIVDLARSK